jgi:predicted PurR-regulated permease PerM
MVPSSTARAVLVILAVLAIALLLAVALPFATPLFVAAVLAGALAPWMDWLSRVLGGRRNAAAGLLTAAVLVAVVGPLSGLGAALVPQMVAAFGWIRGALSSEGLAGLVDRVPESLRPIAEQIHQAIPETLDRLQELVTAEGGRAASVLGNLLSATGAFLIRSILMLIALYFMLLDGPALVHWLNESIPLKRGQVSELLRDFRRVTVTVLVSTVLTAAVQSGFALVGYLIAGVPSPFFFSLATFILALVPVLGATIVVLAVAAVQIGTGHVGGGVFLAIYAVGVVAMVDNVVKPMFIRGGVPIHGAVIFFALFGGLAAFGPVGFLVGPLAVSFLVAVIRMYRRDYTSGHPSPAPREKGPTRLA